MLLEPVWHLLEEQLFTAEAGPGLFNPYADRDGAHDQPDAVAIRQANLRQYLAAYTARPDVFLLAEAPGPWGCRFSGVPITSEAQLLDPAFPLSGAQSSARLAPHTEYSANIYWRVMAPYFPRFFTWNSVPFHPFKPGEPFSIRTPKSSEVKAFGGVLHGLLDLLQPTAVLAIGRKAEYALNQIGVTATYVRHPSQGGARLFEAGIHAAFQDTEIP